MHKNVLKDESLSNSFEDFNVKEINKDSYFGIQNMEGPPPNIFDCNNDESINFDIFDNIKTINKKRKNDKLHKKSDFEKDIQPAEIFLEKNTLKIKKCKKNSDYKNIESSQATIKLSSKNKELNKNSNYSAMDFKKNKSGDNINNQTVFKNTDTSCKTKNYSNKYNISENFIQIYLQRDSNLHTNEYNSNHNIHSLNAFKVSNQQNFPYNSNITTHINTNLYNPQILVNQSADFSNYERDKFNKKNENFLNVPNQTKEVFNYQYNTNHHIRSNTLNHMPLLLKKSNNIPNCHNFASTSKNNKFEKKDKNDDSTYFKNHTIIKLTKICNGNFYIEYERVRLKVSFSKLLTYKTVNKSKIEYFPTLDEVKSDFFILLNTFNSNLGIPFIGYGLCNKLRKLFEKIITLGGFYKIKMKDWSKMVKSKGSVSLYKKIYMYFVYPLEQMYVEKNGINLYHKSNFFNEVFKLIFQRRIKDFYNCLKKGNSKNLIYLLNHAGNILLEKGMFVLIYDLYFDTHNLIMEKIQNTKNENFLFKRLQSFDLIDLVIIKKICFNLIVKYLERCEIFNSVNIITDYMMNNLISIIYKDDLIIRNYKRIKNTIGKPLNSIMALIKHKQFITFMNAPVYKCILKIAKTDLKAAIIFLSKTKSLFKHKKRIYNKIKYNVVKDFEVFHQNIKDKVLVNDFGFIQAFVKSFVRIKELECKFRALYFDIFEYYYHFYKRKIYFRYTRSSDLHFVVNEIKLHIKIDDLSEYENDVINRSGEVPIIREFFNYKN